MLTGNDPSTHNPLDKHPLLSPGEVYPTVFLPFDTAALFVKQFTNVKVSSASIWWWVQDFGSRAKKRLDNQLTELVIGQMPTVEPMDKKISSLPLAIGGDGVMDGTFSLPKR